jgi:hypothetical protein
VADTLAEMITAMAATLTQTQEQRLVQIGREQFDAIRREAKRGRWRREAQRCGGDSAWMASPSTAGSPPAREPDLAGI